jgi:hypothetical protein
VLGGYKEPLVMAVGNMMYYSMHGMSNLDIPEECTFKEC